MATRENPSFPCKSMWLSSGEIGCKWNRPCSSFLELSLRDRKYVPLALTWVVSLRLHKEPRFLTLWSPIPALDQTSRHLWNRENLFCLRHCYFQFSFTTAKPKPNSCNLTNDRSPGKMTPLNGYRQEASVPHHVGLPQGYLNILLTWQLASSGVGDPRARTSRKPPCLLCLNLSCLIPSLPLRSVC